MPILQGIIQDLRTAYNGHSRTDHEHALRRLEQLGNIVPAGGCSRGDSCICNKHVQSVCMYRAPAKPPAVGAAAQCKNHYYESPCPNCPK